MDVRDEFLKFFASKGHRVCESMPLVPDDASLLFTNAGMVQFKDIFTGKVPAPANPRATSSQLCIRAGGKHNDLENVGYTARHHTLFEMLGNFSFGDYFKEEAIEFAWEFVTQILGFPKDKLYVSVHHSDDEAFGIWSKLIDSSRIKKMDDKDNFWQMGDVGPCGPCSEIYIDQGEEHFRTSEDYFGGEGDRFLEIWNLVFMQYERDKEGNLNPLPKPSIDTGMGLERVVALMEGKRNNFDTSLFAPLMRKIEEITGLKYYCDDEITESSANCGDLSRKAESQTETQASFRVIADHSRSIAFLLAQGMHFDKEGRGYVLRRILRRAVRHGYLLGLRKAFIYEVVGAVCDCMGAHYTYLLERKEAVQRECKAEEERFFETIESGMSLFNAELDSTHNVFSGEVAFRLYDTYGFPLDLTQDMLKDKGIEIDLEAFERCMDAQKSRSKASWKGSGDEVKEGDFLSILEEFGENEFIGYTHNEAHCKILALFDSDYKRVESISHKGYVFFDKTPLYAEGGGPVGDSGEVFNNAWGDGNEGNEGKKIADIIYTKKYFGLNISEIGNVNAGAPLKVGDEVFVKVSPNRAEIAKHHSATHLLHASLRKILGNGVAQAGSLVESARLRFDFTHPSAIDKDTLDAIEREVNAMINAAVGASIELVSRDDAKKRGAMALFGEKYGQIVRMVSFGSVSCELCGGIHIDNTAKIGNFYIVKESGISSGVRRIEAVCGKAGYEYAKENFALLANARSVLKNNDIIAGIQKLKDNLSRLKDLKNKTDSGEGLKSLKFEMVGKSKLFVAEVAPSINIKTAIDEVKRDNDKVAIFLITNDSGKINLSCGVKNIATLKANEWIKEACKIIGGGGGGRDDFATAGGKYADKIAESLENAREFARARISGE